VGGTPETRYARSGGVDIAYQVVGEGDGIDIVFVPGWISNIEVAWECAELARFLDRLASLGRLVIFDKRGTGLSDRVGGTPTLEERADDIRAVIDAVGLPRPALVGWFDAGAMTAHFAATYPDRVQALVVGCFTEKALSIGHEASGLDDDVLRRIAEAIETDGWGSARLVPLLAPSWPTTSGS
jgi:pimeloyl-ACP methyl ester carboxylesterase